ncbi:MAG TPA: indole-3-glycerol phosphate synthase TrpC [Syntrophales bacterium]|nr:indole-3-glycerol phosphate synthase TrpC [Syntrophales bacterium]
MVLDKIIEVKNEQVANLKRIRPLQELKHAIPDLPWPVNFHDAIGGRELAIIAEVKRRSPSKGVFREDFDPVRIALLYEENGAAAISVLTDRVFFGGDDAYLAAIKQHVRLPLLRKDFIIDSYQIYETRVLRGDAILLISGILTNAQLTEYVSLARSLGLSVICEVHSHVELARALASDARIIGINNRNLATFAVDLKTSASLATSIPGDRTIVSESGIRTSRDIDALKKAGIHSFLIGETLMQSPNMGQKLRELLGEL